MNTQFDKAVEYAKMVLGVYVSEGKLSFPEMEPDEVFLRWSVPFYQNKDELGFRIIHPPHADEWLMDISESSRGAHDLLCQVVASKLFRGEALSEKLRVFAALRVVDRAKAPKKSGRASKSYMRNLILVMAAKAISRQFQLPLTRNEGSEEHSTSDAISLALDQLGHALSWRAIKELIVHPSNVKLMQSVDELQEAITGQFQLAPAFRQIIVRNSRFSPRDEEHD